MLEVIGSLEKDKTRYVIWDTTFESVMAPAFLPSYRPPADRNRVIEPYLNEHYIQIAFENGFRFMERKSPKLADVAIAAATIQTTGQLQPLSGRHANLFVPARHGEAQNKRLGFTASLGQARRTSSPGSESSHGPVIFEPGL